jgi:hypothetical protein
VSPNSCGRSCEACDPQKARFIAQLNFARATGGIPTTFDPDVESGAPRRDADDGPLPGRTLVRRPNTESNVADLIGEVLVWISDGHLSGLEYAWYTVETPTAMPNADSAIVHPAAP